MVELLHPKVTEATDVRDVWGDLTDVPGVVHRDLPVVSHDPELVGRGNVADAGDRVLEGGEDVEAAPGLVPNLHLSVIRPRDNGLGLAVESDAAYGALVALVVLGQGLLRVVDEVPPWKEP